MNGSEGTLRMFAIDARPDVARERAEQGLCMSEIGSRRLAWRAAWIVFGLASLVLAEPRAFAVNDDADASQLRLKIGKITPAASASITRAGQGGRIANAGQFVIQLDGPLTPARLAALSRIGVTLGDYLPNFAYIVRLPAGFDTTRLGDLGFVRWAGPFEKGWKLDPEIGQMQVQSAARRALRGQGLLQLDVSLFAGEKPGAALASIRGISGAAIVATEQSGDVTRIRVNVPRAGYAQLADIASVQWVGESEEPMPRNYPGNWIGQSNVQDSFPIWNHGLTGQGQIGGLIDGNYFGTEGLNADHCSFRDPGGNPIGPLHRKLVAYFGTNAYDLHATHTSGTMVGNEQPITGTTTNRGIAYDAKLAFTNLNLLNTNSLLSMLTQDAGAGARVHSNSWGGGSALYNQWCVDIDKFMYDDEDQLVVFAVINGGGVKNPENAKNLLAVSASGDAPNQANYCSGSTGPTADGRRRPEIMATGCNVMSSASAGVVCDFQADTGTSMACPLVAGSAILVRQYFMSGFYPSGSANGADAFTPSGALLKAVLINSAVDMTGIAGYPSNQEGWGRMLLDNALYFAGDSRKLVRLADTRNANGMTTGQTQTFTGVINSSSEPLRITLGWTEKQAALNANPTYINNLDLEVTINSTLYRGNDFSLGQSTTGGPSDTKNNIEQVMLLSPPAGPFSVTVRATAVNTPLPQGFALVATGDIAVAPSVMSIAPNSGTSDQIVSITDLLGSEFRAGATFSIRHSSSSPTIGATGVTLVSAGKLTGQLDLAAAPAGLYDVIVTNPDGQTATLANAFSVSVVCSPADVNNDGIVDGGDIQPFMNALVASSGTPRELCSADVNQDTVIDAIDVPAFVQCLTQTGPCPP